MGWSRAGARGGALRARLWVRFDGRLLRGLIFLYGSYFRFWWSNWGLRLAIEFSAWVFFGLGACWWVLFDGLRLHGLFFLDGCYFDFGYQIQVFFDWLWNFVPGCCLDWAIEFTDFCIWILIPYCWMFFGFGDGSLPIWRPFLGIPGSLEVIGDLENLCCGWFCDWAIRFFLFVY